MRKIATIIVLIFLLSSCKEVEKDVVINDAVKIESILGELTSAYANGRLPGTAGNKYIEEVLVKYFDDIGLEPYVNESYLNPYSQDFYDSEKQISKMVILKEGGNERELEYGIDFLQSTSVNCDINYPVVLSTHLADENAIILVEDRSDLSSIITKDHTKAILLRSDNFKKYLQMSDTSIPVIQISNAVYHELLGSKERVHIQLSYSKATIEANNVVGKIAGTNHEKAIIITAHFDSIGTIGDSYCSGALDNASGIFALTELAKKLEEYSKSNELPMDIIICAINGEESGMNGSKSFAEEIKNRYQDIFNINLDTVGMVNSGNYYILGDEAISKNLIESINSYMNKAGIHTEVNYSIGLESDHISFSSLSIPSLTIGDKQYEYIHSLKDTYETVDEKAIIKLAETLFGFLISELNNLIDEQAPSVSDVPVENIYDRDRQNYMDTLRAELTYDQYKVVEYEGGRECVYPYSLEAINQEEVNQYFKNLKVSSQFGDYQIKKIDVSVIPPGIDFNTIKLEQIYTRSLTEQDISSLSMEYQLDNKLFRLTVFNSNQENFDRFIDMYENDPYFKLMDITIDEIDYILVYNEQDRRVYDIRAFIKDTSIDIGISRGDLREITDEEGKTIEGIDSDIYIDNMDDVEALIKSINVNEFTNIIGFMR